MAELIALKIPNGWAVSDNKFYDVEPTFDQDGFIENWYEGFTDDVLLISECKVLDNGNLGIPQSDYFIIDISWLPESTIKGCYVATLNWYTDEEWNKIESISSKDRHLIKEKIEYWMMDVFQNYHEYQERMMNLKKS